MRLAIAPDQEQSKACTKCGCIKPISSFHRRSTASDGRNSHCKDCQKLASGIWRNRNPGKMAQYSADWRNRNPERAREQNRQKNREWRERRPEMQRAANARYRAKNREAIRSRQSAKKSEQSQYYQENRERIIQRNMIRARERRREEPAFRQLQYFRSRFGRWFRARGIKKDRRVMEAVGCDADQLLRYLEAQFEPGMSWDNYGIHGWHIDHIVPLSSAGDDPDAMAKLWHYTNLQPLWAAENLSKGGSA